MNICVISMNLSRQILLILVLTLSQVDTGFSKNNPEKGAIIHYSGFLMDDTPALSTLKKRFNDGVMYRADLSHQFTDAYTGETTSSYGSIWITRDSYKIDTPDQIIIVDNLVSTVYNKKQNRVIYSNYSPEEDDFAPSRYFAGAAGEYESKETANSDGSTTITITTADAFEQFKEVVIRVSRNGTPTQIDAIDQMDNTIKTTFRFGRFESSDQSIFAFQPPVGAEVVDMRE